jgi:blue copper oxidase
LQYSASLLAVGSGLALVGCGQRSTAHAAFNPYQNDPVPPENFTNPLFISGARGAFGVLNMTDLPLTLNTRAVTFPILGGRASPFLLYETSYSGTSFQNPIFKIKRGRRFTATLQNGLNEPTLIHWHGLHLPANMDGYPNDSFGPGAIYPYDFTVNIRGGMYWYHTYAPN